MAITNGYLTLVRFKDEYGTTSSAKDEEIERAIESASRLIDEYCDRIFYDTGSATAKTFRADDPYELEVPDFSTTTGLVVKTDTTDDGTFDTTWTSSDYQLEPLNPTNGYPYTRIVAVDTETFPTGGRRARVQVTARWGWTAVPKRVEQACLVQTYHWVNAATHIGGGVNTFDVEGGGAYPVDSKYLARTAQLLLDGLRRLDVGAV